MEEKRPNVQQEADLGRGPSDASNPLRGVVLCCTAIQPEKRTELASQAQQMGAQHKFDLTSDVTHLLVGGYDTPKYRYVARERPDVKVLTPDWIEAVRLLWIEDKHIDLDAVEQEHTLPTLTGLRICMTGFEDQDQRQNIIDLVVANGGDYHGDLTKRVTHLIAYRPEGAKYRHAKTWNIHLVAIEWLQDSLERGMILEENLYGPESPAGERGKGAWIRRKRSPLGKRSRDDSVASLEDGKRKLRRTASTKLTSQNEKIWGDIFSGSNIVQAANSGIWGSVTEEAPDEADAIPVNRGKSAPDSNGLFEEETTVIHRGTFHGCQFYINNFDRKKAQVLQKHLLSHDAKIAASIQDFVAKPGTGLYAVVPHSLRTVDLPDITNPEIQWVTDWWVERCLEAKALVPPMDYILGRPFRKFPLEGFENLTICSTGFEGMQLLHVSKVVALMGAKYEEMFSKDASVLICNSFPNLRREKLVSAQEWSMPMVSLDWLLDSVKHGERQPFKLYIQRTKKPNSESEPDPAFDKDTAYKQKYEDEPIKADFVEKAPKEAARPAKASKLDTTAFQDDGPIKVKIEEPSTQESSSVLIEALTEISPNSPRKAPQTPSKARKSLTPKVLSPAIPREAISTAISSILARSKSAVSHTHDHSEQSDAPEGIRKKRAPSRILGRAASNVSAASASSVDSTASRGHAVAWPDNKVGSKEQRSSSSLRAISQQGKSSMAMIEDLVAHEAAEAEDNTPPQTQMQYDDPESSEYKERVLARIKGVEHKKKEKAKVVTIASLDGEGLRLKKGRTLRDRKSGGFR